jgi:hypothetical protein
MRHAGAPDLFHLEIGVIWSISRARRPLCSPETFEIFDIFDPRSGTMREPLSKASVRRSEGRSRCLKPVLLPRHVLTVALGGHEQVA